jgi:hypothetical protein
LRSPDPQPATVVLAHGETAHPRFPSTARYRLLPKTSGRAGVPAAIHNWMGESRGHWEDGNTLVVKTTNFRPGTSATNIVTTGSPPQNDTPISSDARIVERFTMTSPDTIVYEVTHEDQPSDHLLSVAPLPVRSRREQR